ncbi:hypothetical protein RUND412_009292 [Rhizina undulata]
MAFLGFNAKSLRIWASFVLVLLVPSLVALIPFPNFKLITRERSVQCYVPSDDNCGSKGDGEIYGLGIRIGFYLQWISFCLAEMFYPEEQISLLEVNNCFLGSMLVGLIYRTINNSELYAAEAFLVV